MPSVRTCLLVVALMGLAAPALGGPSPSLVGTWTGSLWGEEVRLVFGADGRGDLMGDPVTWSVQGSTLVFAVEGERLVYAWQLQGGALTLSGGDLVAPLVLTRQGGGAAGSDPGLAAPTGAGKGQATRHVQESWGATLTVPAGWKLAERDGVLLLGSDTEAGLIVLRFARKTGVPQLRQQVAEGLEEDGARLLPTGAAADLQAGPNVALAGDLSGAAADGTPLKARAIGVTSRYGDAVIVLGVTSPAAFEALRARVAEVASSLVFTKPKVLPAASFLAGHYWTYSGSSGYSTERKLVLCRDGRFDRGSESGGSGRLTNQTGDVTATYGAVGAQGARGRWSASGDAQRGTLVLQHADGRIDEVPYVVSQDRADQSGYGPAVTFGGTKYQRTGDGSCP